jgi:uncharacterized protein (UPF0332 family)
MSESEKYLELSETALKDFELGKEAGQSIRTLYNRLYYAVFYSAQAALASEEIEVKTHRGAADKVFTQLYDGKDLLSKETAAVISQIQTKRDESDYQLEISETEEDLEEIERKSKKFIEKMREIAVS